MIDWTINIGHVATFVMAIFTIAGFYFGTRNSIKQLKNDLSDVKIELKAIAKIMTEVAVQNTRIVSHTERLDRLERWYDELRRGVGIVRNDK